MSHRSLSANVLQLSRPELVQFREHDTLVGLLPFFHIYGMNAVLSAGLYLGGTTIVVEKFEPNSLLDLLLKYKVNI